MISATLEEITRVVGGKIFNGPSDTVVSSVSTDSRSLKEGDLFVALQGDNFDGGRFAGEAVKKGAAALMLESGYNTAVNSSDEPVDIMGHFLGKTLCNPAIGSLPPEIPVVLVENSLKALQALARHNRIRSGVSLVAVTGSSGKTTTKDIIASVLSERYITIKTQGNLNNEIGVPLTLLSFDACHRAAVVEMAMRGPGEIDHLGSMAAPDAAVITNAGEAHIERLGSLDNIARAKGELLEHVPPEGFAVLHGDNPLLRAQASRCPGKVIFFGEATQNEVRPLSIKPLNGGNALLLSSPWGQFELFVPLPGRHNVLNCLAAAAVALQMGLSFEEIQKGLHAATVSAMRLEIDKLNGLTIINDAYNANPSSTTGALQVLAEISGTGRRIAVLGDMLELGFHAEEGHSRVGRAAFQNKVDLLVTVGRHSVHTVAGALESGLDKSKAFHFDDNAGALRFLTSIVLKGDTVLVKGSRGMGMEQLVRGLTDWIGGAGNNRCDNG